ncbi:uncharacterized protein LOC134232929 [Saccostrea cucullata]|uniref:uncharacterized protein LOC134232929 n=1 Tax=Saccostrea cuccullata TaxID=36930 RepID=UPI002ED5A5A3
MTYRGFGYVVDSCPTSETEFISAATRLNCSEDQYGRNQYTCVPNKDRSALVEFCYSKIVGLYQKGHCLESFGDGFLDQISCNHFQAGCPDENFRGTDLHKFPACSKINTENRCFYADPSCSNRTEINPNNQSTPVGGIINSTMSILTTETGNVVEESSDAGVIKGSTIFLVLILFLVLAIIFWKRRMSKKRKYKETPLEMDLLQGSFSHPPRLFNKHTLELNIRSLVIVRRFFEAKMFFKMVNVVLALPILALMSQSVPPCLSTTLPR